MYVCTNMKTMATIRLGIAMLIANILVILKDLPAMLCKQNTCTLMIMLRTRIRHERATDQTPSQDELQQHPRTTTDATECVSDSSQRCLHCTGPVWASDVSANLPQRGAPEC